MAKKYVGGRGWGRGSCTISSPRRPTRSPEKHPDLPDRTLYGIDGAGVVQVRRGDQIAAHRRWCDSYSSGRYRSNSRRQGYDGLVIRGRANAPCYLQIGDGGVEIRRRAALGMDSFAAEKALKELPGNAAAAVSSIVPPGRNSAATLHQQRSVPAGRPGRRRTVMGAKRLKAIVAKGRGRSSTTTIRRSSSSTARTSSEPR